MFAALRSGSSLPSYPIADRPQCTFPAIGALGLALSADSEIFFEEIGPFGWGATLGGAEQARGKVRKPHPYRGGDMALDPARKRGRTSKISRERILEASLYEFADHGYEGATTASVARRVGVTQPLIHYHFGSK